MVLKVYILIIKIKLKDYLIVGSDSGRIVILEYNAFQNTFERVLIIKTYDF